MSLTDWKHDRCQYRIRYHFKNWREKPDPSGFGVQYIYSDDPSWLHEEANKLKRKGHWGIQIQVRKK